MRTNIPSFRLPERVLTEEIDTILNMGVEIRYNSPVESMAALARSKASTPSSSAAARRAARISICPDATTPTASTSASTGSAPSLSDTPIPSANAS